MINRPTTLKGIVHGKVVQLEREAGLPDGQAVAVTLVPTNSPNGGLQRAFEAWRDDAGEVEKFDEQVREDRKRPRAEPSE